MRMLEWEQGVEGNGRVYSYEYLVREKKGHRICCQASFLFDIIDNKVAGYL